MTRMNKSKVQQRIETMNKLRGRPLTAREQLNNLAVFLKEQSDDAEYHESIDWILRFLKGKSAQ